MVLVRIAYVADMPTPDEAIRMLEQNGGASPVVAASGAPRGAPASTAVGGAVLAGARVHRAPRAGAEASARPQMIAPAAEAQAAPRRAEIASFPELVALAAEKRDLLTKAALEADVRLVRIEDGRLEVAMERSAARTPDQRSVAQARAMDRAALDRDRVQRGRAADAARRRAGRRRTSASAPPKPIRACRRCWRDFPAPRWSRCASLPRSRRNPMLAVTTSPRIRQRRRIAISEETVAWLIFSA